MFRSIILVSGAVVALTLQGSALAMNGFAVTTAARTGWVPENSGNPTPGKIVRIDIAGNAESGRATIYDGLAYYPTISFDGTRVAFLRLDAKLNSAGTGLIGRLDTGYVSIVNKDGTGFKDLIKLYCGQSGWGANWADCGGHFSAWPAGNWVYYEKPPKTGEIWRVNVQDTSLRHLVVRYNDTLSGAHDSNCACSAPGATDGSGFWLRRWQLSADAKYCAGMFKWYGDGPQQMPHRFPPPDGHAPLTMSIYPDFPACNLSMSASGEHLAAYFAGCHDVSNINRWDHATNVGPRYNGVQGAGVNLYTDVRTWCGRDVGNLGSYMRWAANSDKWLLVEASYGCGGGSSGANQVLCNWKDRAGMCFTGVYSGGSMYYDAGSLWISDPANNPGGNKYEDPNGNWVTVSPRDIYLNWAVTGTSPYRVTIAAYPPDADIRYTADGVDPTQSSTRYTAPLDLTPSAGRAMQIRARAFKTGMSPAETESRILVPSSKALPAGYLKDMLCLEDAQGTMGVLNADTGAVMTKYSGENKAIPFDGDQVAINGHTYTWRLRTDSDGIWSPVAASGTLTFWYTTIIQPQNSQVGRLGTLYNTGLRLYLNGISQFGGWDAKFEQTYGSNDGASIGLVKGANGVLLVHPSTSSFGVRFLDKNSVARADLRYFPYSGLAANRPSASQPGRPVASVAVLPGHLSILPGSARTARISDVNGRTERMVRGLSSAACHLSLSDLGTGIHLVTLLSDAGEQTWRVLVR